MKHAVNCFTTWILLVLTFFAAAAQAQEESATEPAAQAPAAQQATAQQATAQEATAQEAPAQEATAQEATAPEPTAPEATAPEPAATESEAAKPATVSLDENTCVQCHGTAELWDDSTKHLYVRAEDLANDIHWTKGIQCQDCHGGNVQSTDFRTAHAVEDGFRKIDKAANEPAFCGYCHSDPEKMKSYGSSSSTTVVSDFLSSVHGQHLQQQVGDEKSVTCTSCHARHAMLAKDDMNSPVFVQNQVETCGHCHEAAWNEYRASVHGQGLEKSGLIKTAVCANCHGAHGILKAEDPKSRLNATHVAETCGACHRFIEDRLVQSVHGKGNGPGGATAQSAPGGTIRRKPSCTDCHVGHDLPDPRSAGFRNREPDRCGNCHTDLYARYGMSMHGELSNLGYTEGAKCSDCHGAHDILPLSDPNSLMAPGNRAKTCSACHADMAPNLASFDPHADHHNAKRSPLVYWFYRGVLTFIIVVFGFFGVHAICWFIRSLFDVLRHGRPKQLAPNDAGYLRFRPFHRVAHTVMVVSFLGLALTGLPLKFSDYRWAQWLAAALGGFASTGVWHRVFSISMFGCFFAYVLLLTHNYFVRRRQGKSRREVIFGPDSPLPNLRDAKDLSAMIRWFVCRGPKPTFERWAYWEKFDFFGATSDTILIGVTGLVLWFPNWFCLFLPGEAVNVAKVVHSTLALLATGFVFAIHFFGTHFRPDKFPMDVSVLTGVVSEEEMEHERPEMLARLRAEGRLEELRLTAPNHAKLCGVRTLGLIALLVGLAALAGIVWSLLQ